MSSEGVLQRLRLFLLGLSAFMCVGVLVELSLINHLEEPIQALPFILAGAALAVIAWVLARPGRAALLTLRGVMALTALGSLIGVYEHIAGNVAFEMEIRPNASLGQIILPALGGANPLLAPGILGLAAVIAIAATYYHPRLTSPT